jgi:hypothetical protein
VPSLARHPGGRSGVIGAVVLLATVAVLLSVHRSVSGGGNSDCDLTGHDRLQAVQELARDTSGPGGSTVTDAELAEIRDAQSGAASETC